MKKVNATSMEVVRDNPPTSSDLQPLTPEQEDRFFALEEDITNNMSSALKLASALAEIRASKLYRYYECDSFEEYCKRRWDYSRSYCLRLADAHTVLTDLKGYETNEVYPRTEAQARVFVPLNKDQRITLLKTVYEQSNADTTTASELTKFRKKLYPETYTRKPERGKSKDEVIDVEEVQVTNTKPAVPSIMEAVEAAEKALNCLDDKKAKDTPWAEPLRKFLKSARPVVEWEKGKGK